MCASDSPRNSERLRRNALIVVLSYLQILFLVMLESRRDFCEKGIRFTDEINQAAVAQVVERGYALS